MIRRVAKLVRFEWQKLAARRFALVALVVVALVAALTPLAGKVVEGRLAEHAQGSEAADFENGWTALASGIDWGLTIGRYLVLLFAASAVAEESQQGTLKTLLARPVKRLELLLSKWIALCGYSLLLLALVTVAAAIVGRIGHDYGPVVDPTYHQVVKTSASQMLGIAIAGVGLVLPSLIALVAFGLLFSCAIDHPGYAVGGAITSYFVLDAIANLSRRAAVYLLPHYALLSVTYFKDIAQMFPEKGEFLEATPLIVAVPLASALLFFVVAALLLRTREVAE